MLKTSNLAADLNLLNKVRYFLQNGYFTENVISIALAYLFKSEYLMCVYEYSFGHDSMRSLYSFIPEMFDSEIEFTQPVSKYHSTVDIDYKQKIVEQLRDKTPDIGEYYNGKCIINLEPCDNCNDEFFCDTCSKELDILNKIRDWYVNGKVGASSSSVCTASFLKSPYLLYDKPHDIHDMGRCSLLVEYIPEIKSYISDLSKTKNLSEDWVTILSSCI